MLTPFPFGNKNANEFEIVPCGIKATLHQYVQLQTQPRALAHTCKTAQGLLHFVLQRSVLCSTSSNPEPALSRTGQTCDT